MSDLISRDFLLKSIDYIADIGGIWGRAFTAYKEAFKEFVEGMPPAQRWIPVTERLPEDDKEVLITYKGKGDELDKPYSKIDITTYGQMYFGGIKVDNYKDWRSPFLYFYDNYEVTAWMPLPECYRGDA